MYTESFVTIDINHAMLKRKLMAAFIALRPNMAESLDDFYRTFVACLEEKLAEEIINDVAYHYQDYMKEWHREELAEIDRKDKEFFEEHLMWPACHKCKAVDERTGFYSVCVNAKRFQCSSAQGAEEWVNSERYQDALKEVTR